MKGYKRTCTMLHSRSRWFQYRAGLNHKGNDSGAVTATVVVVGMPRRSGLSLLVKRENHGKKQPASTDAVTALRKVSGGQQSVTEIRSRVGEQSSLIRTTCQPVYWLLTSGISRQHHHPMQHSFPPMSRPCTLSASTSAEQTHVYPHVNTYTHAYVFQAALTNSRLPKTNWKDWKETCPC